MKHLLRVCLERGLKTKHKNIYDQVLALCLKIVSKYGEKYLGAMLTVAEDVMAVVAGKPEPDEKSTPSGQQFLEGQEVMAMWTDKKWYKATIKKLVCDIPAKYSVFYPDHKKSAAVPVKAIKKMEEDEDAPKVTRRARVALRFHRAREQVLTFSRVCAQVVKEAKADPNRHNSGLLTVYAQIGALGDSQLKLKIADVISEELQVALSHTLSLLPLYKKSKNTHSPEGQGRRGLVRGPAVHL